MRPSQAAVLPPYIFAFALVFVAAACGDRAAPGADEGARDCSFRELTSLGRGRYLAAIAIDDAHVYWTDQGYVGSDGSVMRIAKGGGNAETVARDQLSPRGIAASHGFVYWVNEGSSETNARDGTVMRAALGGGDAVVIAAGQNHPRAVAVNATHVYWTNYAFRGAVMRASLEGDAITTIQDVAYPADLALGADDLYWVSPNEGAVMKVPLASGEAVALVSNQPEIRALALETSSLYFAADLGGVKNGSIDRIELATARTTTIAKEQTGIGALASGPKGVFWSAADDTGSIIMTAPLGGGAPSRFYGSACTDAASARGGFAAMVLEASHAYWLSTGSDQSVLKAAY